jgi:hypothetical protein
MPHMHTSYPKLAYPNAPIWPHSHARLTCSVKLARASRASFKSRESPMIQLLLSDSIQITDGPHGLIVHFNSQSFPLTSGRAESILTNLLLHIRCGVSHTRISEHLRDHQSSTVIGTHCPCCKLEGRLLYAQGRKSSSEADRLIAARAHTGGKVEVRHIKPGLSGAQLKAYESAYNTRTTPHPTNIVKSVNKRIEDLI